MDIAKCVRIFEPEPDDDFVTKRESAIRDLRTNFLKKKQISELMAIGSGVCEVFLDSPSIPNVLANPIEAAIKKHSPSFVKDDHHLEMGVCAAAAVVQSVSLGVKPRQGWMASDVLAVSLWSALSFMPACKMPKLEEFRALAIDAARNRILKTSLETRVRYSVPKIGLLGDGELSQEAIASAINALENNAALDREELDILWWTLPGMSSIFNRPLQSLPPEVRAVTAGIEIGALMRALPTQSHRNLALRGLEEAGSVPLPKLLTALGEERLRIAASFQQESLVEMAPLVFPLLSAVRSGEATGTGADLPRPLSEWGARALLERTVLRIQYEDNRTT